MAGDLAAIPDCTILLVRHAHAGMAGRFCGTTDPALSDQGHRELPKLWEELEKYPLTHVLSSDLLRAQQTASFIALKAGLETELIAGLREIYFGDWEGLDWDKVNGKDPAFAARWMAEYPLLPAPGGEDFGVFRHRVRSAMAGVAERIVGGCAAVVTHAGVIRTFLLDVLQVPESGLAGIECGYASCIEISLRAGSWCLRK